METRSAVFQYRSDCCTIEIHNVIKGNTSPFQENNETQALICFLNAIYNVIVPFQFQGYRNTQYLRTVGDRKLVSVYLEREKVMSDLLKVDNHLLALVGIQLHLLGPRPVLHGSNSVLHITQGAARYGLGDQRPLASGKPQTAVTRLQFRVSEMSNFSKTFSSVQFSSFLLSQNVIQYKNTYRNFNVAREPRRNQKVL